MEQRKVILSGVTPSGILTIGHLTGALTNWVKLQNEYDCYYMIADLHAITAKQTPAELRKRTLDTAAMFIASGIDPVNSTLFIQSHVPEHSQLTWVLNTFTGMGECSRMTQFKDKSRQHSENINVGLFTYPVLMAADILLYQADLVPVGEDQKQHLELTRNLAQRFNHNYSDTFKVPEPYIPEIGARIMSLQEPEKKMSKSDPIQGSIIFLTDTDEQIVGKIKRAVTDSGSDVIFDEENKPGVANLMTLYHIATGKSMSEIENEFAGKGYGDFKSQVGDSVAEFISPIRNRYNELIANKDELAKILISGGEKARHTALRTLRKVYKKVGFVQF
ncbi:MAG: tryptophan--tRNA ligase [Ignavibacteriae bacterium HGW-Ignavibacteriae-1]|jgi:tryptophanyl-tRNA synthetase|nr:MAG: tryptophan--tRNA ligase [Ignavibacteriae bacterium HGW-Ignavibacteriae-1]